MPVLKFIGGALALWILIGAVALAVPRFADDMDVPEAAALLWSRGETTLRPIPVRHKLAPAQLQIARDGSMLAFETGGRGAGKYLASQQFVDAPGAQPLAPPSSSNHWQNYADDRLVDLGQGSWLLIEQSAVDRLHRTALYTDGSWTEGPPLASEGPSFGAARMSDGSLVIVGIGYLGLELFSGRPGDAKFRSLIKLPGERLTGLNELLTHVNSPVAGLDGTHVLVAWAASDAVHTFAADLPAAAITEGPTLPMEPGQRLAGISGGAVAGGLLIALHRTAHGYDSRLAVMNVIGLLLLLGGFFLARSLRRRGHLTRAVLFGAIGGVLVIAALVYLIALAASAIHMS